jgi:hypothetical protein
VRPTHEPEDLKAEFKSQTKQVWVALDDYIRALAITTILEFPRRKLLKIIGCTGRGYKDWSHLVSGIENFARLEGCSHIEAIARPGWHKILKDYRKTHIRLDKCLTSQPKQEQPKPS